VAEKDELDHGRLLHDRSLDGTATARATPGSSCYSDPLVLENPIRLLARLPGTVRLLVAGTLINKAGTFIVPYLTIVLLRDFALTETEAARLLFAYGAGSIVSIMVGGFLTDHLGRRQTLLLSLLGSGAIAVGMGFATSARVFVPLLVLFGFVADLYRPAASAIIGDLLPSAQRATGFAALRMAVNLGFAVGMGLGGVLADWSWRALFFGDGATTLLYGLVVYFFIAETRPLGAAAVSTSAAGGPSPLTDRVYLQVVLATFAFCLMFFSHISVMPLTVTISAGYPAVVYGVLLGTNGLLIALFEISVVGALRRFRRLRVAALGMALAGVGFAMTGLVLHWAWFLATVVLWTVGEILTAPQQMAFIADWAPPAARGRYLSLYQASWSLSFALNPVLFLPLHSRLGEPLFWGLLIFLAIPATLLLLRVDHADRPERLRGLTPDPAPTPEILGALTPEG
jgi:MFS family permease